MFGLSSRFVGIVAAILVLVATGYFALFGVPFFVWLLISVLAAVGYAYLKFPFGQDVSGRHIRDEIFISYFLLAVSIMFTCLTSGADTANGIMFNTICKLGIAMSVAHALALRVRLGVVQRRNEWKHRR